MGRANDRRQEIELDSISRRQRLVGCAVFLRIEHLGEPRIFLEKGEIFVVASVIAIFRTELDRNFQILHRRIRFSGETIKRGQRVVDVVRLGRRFARLIEAFSGVVPSPDIHHGDAALIVLISGARILLGARLHTLLGNLQVHAGAIGEFFAGSLENLLQFLLGLRKFLLVKKCQRFVINL